MQLDPTPSKLTAHGVLCRRNTIDQITAFDFWYLIFSNVAFVQKHKPS